MVMMTKGRIIVGSILKGDPLSEMYCPISSGTNSRTEVVCLMYCGCLWLLFLFLCVVMFFTNEE